MAGKGMVRIGVSGWRYPPWRGIFYPKKLAQRRELEYASQTFPSIEINGSFYSLQRPSSYAAWYRDTPGHFVFSIKGGRYITHILRLNDIGTALANFFASGVFNLREKTGPFLWQFPPHFRYDARKFEDFFQLLPPDMESALRLARGHDSSLTGKTSLEIGDNLPLRHAVEIRHESFRCPEFVEQLRRHNIAFVFADTAGKWPYFEDATADFIYIRLHGDAELYVSGYTGAALDRWAERIQCWSAGNEPEDAIRVGPKARRIPRDVFCYFDNDVKVRAPFDAHQLMRKFGQSVPIDRSPETAPEKLDQLPYEAAPLGPRWKFQRGPAKKKTSKG